MLLFWIKTVLKDLELSKLSNKLNLKGFREVRSKKLFPVTILDKIIDKLQFSYEIEHYRENSVSIFHEFFASIKKSSVWEKDCALG